MWILLSVNGKLEIRGFISQSLSWKHEGVAARRKKEKKKLENHWSLETRQWGQARCVLICVSRWGEDWLQEWMMAEWVQVRTRRDAGKCIPECVWGSIAVREDRCSRDNYTAFVIINKIFTKFIIIEQQMKHLTLKWHLTTNVMVKV